MRIFVFGSERVQEEIAEEWGADVFEIPFFPGIRGGIRVGGEV